MNAFTKEDLKEFQAESLDDKIQRSLAKIGEWYLNWKNEVYVSFSGGKDSTVLADLCAKWCKIIGATLYLVFADTGLEYPEIRNHVKFFADWLKQKYEIDVQLDIVRPKMRFDEVIKTYGYPIIGKRQADAIYLGRKNIKDKKYTYRLRSLGIKPEDAEKMGYLMPNEETLKRYEETKKGSKFNVNKYAPLLYTDFETAANCCDIMKKHPMKEYQKATGRKPIIATMAWESMTRESVWLKNGCNMFEGETPKSIPMSFWLEQDVLQYIKFYNIPICSVYGDIAYKIDPEQMRIEDYGITAFGCDELCTTGCDRTGCIFCGFGCHRDKDPSRFQKMKETHPRQYQYCIGGGEYNEAGVWQPNKKGLGLGHVFDELNKIYGDGFIKY